MPWELPTSTTQGVSGAVKNAYIPPGGFSSWAKALANSSTTPAVAWVFGGSVGGGGSAVTDVLVNGYFPIWAKAKIAAGFTRHGDTFTPMMSAKWNAAAPQSTPIFVQDITPTAWFPIGPFFVPLWAATGVSLATPQQHYTHPTAALGYRGRSFRVFYWSFGNQDGGSNGAGNTFQYNVNGGAAQTVTFSATNDNFIKSFDITSSTPGWSDIDNQVINFGNQSLTLSMGIIAIASYSAATGPPAGGIHFGWFGVNGFFNLGNLGDMSGQYPADKIARLCAPTGGAAPYTPNAAMSPPFSPDLVFLDIFDDFTFPNQNGVSVSNPTFVQNFLAADAYSLVLDTIVRTLRRKSTGCDIVHMMPNFPIGVVSDVNPQPTYHLENIWAYYRQMWATCVLNGHGFLNTDAEWKELAATGFASAFISGTDPHPTNAGMQDIANRISSRLGL